MVTRKQVERYCVINYTSARYSYPFHGTLASSEILCFYTALCKMNEKRKIKLTSYLLFYSLRG